MAVGADLRIYEREAREVPGLDDLLALAPPPPPPGYDTWTAPLARRTPADFYTAAGPAPHRLLLDSPQPGPLGARAFVTGDPFLLLWHRAGQTYLHLTDPPQTGAWAGDPFAALQGLLARYTREDVDPGTPFPAGAAGYLGYDLRHWVERLPRSRDDRGIPDCVLGFYDSVLTVDYAADRICATAWGAGPAGRARARWEAVEGGSRQYAVAREIRGHFSDLPPAYRRLPPSSVGRTFGPAAYRAAVARVREYIFAGDLYQANLSQRFTVPYAGDPWALYARLRATNPAPFAAYLPLGEATAVSASPERFLQVAGRQVMTRPIKGTRPRGATPAADARLAADLQTSPKDRAENVMIVDLLRNDLGRVCRMGSVRVPELLALESYATVHHLVSTVTGELAPGHDRVDLLRACWPGGSITGAPKIRAMEIIGALEPVARNLYCGSIGYLSFHGTMDTNIAIRTALVQDGQAVVWAGGGIVADSDPAAEYEETLDKAAALLQALGVDRATLDEAAS